MIVREGGCRGHLRTLWLPLSGGKAENELKSRHGLCSISPMREGETLRSVSVSQSSILISNLVVYTLSCSSSVVKPAPPSTRHILSGHSFVLSAPPFTSRLLPNITVVHHLYLGSDSRSNRCIGALSTPVFSSLSPQSFHISIRRTANSCRKTPCVGGLGLALKCGLPTLILSSEAARGRGFCPKFR